MPIRCWPVFKPVAVPAPPSPATLPHAVVGHRHHRHFYGLAHHRPASRIVLVYAGLSCVVVPAVIAGLAGARPWAAGAPSPTAVVGPSVVGLSPLIPGVPPGIIGQAPVVAVPEPSSLAIFATLIALTMAVYWSGVGIGYWFSTRRKTGAQ